jgi:hypothetical protein
VHDRPAGPIRWERYTKPSGGERRIARLDPLDDARYRRLVGPLVPTIERSLGRGVFGNRAVGAHVGPWTQQRRAWRRATLSAIARPDEVAMVVSDVRDCYGSMGERALAQLAPTDELVAFLRRLTDAGVRGLPVGPEPSAILANGILAIADHEAAAAGCYPIRWVDEVIFGAAGRRSAQRAFDAWRRCLEGLGLEAHEGKTRWASGSCESWALARGRPASDLGPVAHGIIPAL